MDHTTSSANHIKMRPTDQSNQKDNSKGQRAKKQIVHSLHKRKSSIEKNTGNFVKAKHMMFGDDKKLAPSDLHEERLHI